MDITELVSTINNLQSNASVGFIVSIYYLIVYWQRIKDGLGLSVNQKTDLSKIEKNYQLLKLRIELEKIKKESGLDEQLLEKLEQEMQSRLEIKKALPFTNSQKFIAIPIIIMILLRSFFELQVLDEASINSSTDILLGALFIITVTIIGFWGIPILQKQQKSWLRKTGFIVFWFFSFYIMCYFFMHIVFISILDIGDLPMELMNLVVLLILISSVVLGVFNRLPFMKQYPSSIKNNNISD